MPVTREKVEKFKKGEIKLAEVFDIDARQVAALLMTGHNLYAQGRMEDAQKIFEGLAVLDSQNPYVHGILGSIYQKQENYDAAVDRYSTAVSIFPQDINSLTNRGEIFLKQGKFQQAAGDFKSAIDLDPEQKHPAANRARLLVTLTQEALKLAKDKGVEAVLEVKRKIDQRSANA